MYERIHFSYLNHFQFWEEMFDNEKSSKACRTYIVVGSQYNLFNILYCTCNICTVIYYFRFTFTDLGSQKLSHSITLTIVLYIEKLIPHFKLIKRNIIILKYYQLDQRNITRFWYISFVLSRLLCVCQVWCIDWNSIKDNHLAIDFPR